MGVSSRRWHIFSLACSYLLGKKSFMSTLDCFFDDACFLGDCAARAATDVDQVNTTRTECPCLHTQFSPEFMPEIQNERRSENSEQYKHHRSIKKGHDAYTKEGNPEAEESSQARGVCPT
mmetsp:Transcript_70048/g.109588  ORF Transcript_70048/g.109588 Transcript_70048/m.109588 type:complete len:120 (-) Transcript_70048:126-485(-)